MIFGELYLPTKSSRHIIFTTIENNVCIKHVSCSDASIMQHISHVMKTLRLMKYNNQHIIHIIIISKNNKSHEHYTHQVKSEPKLFINDLIYLQAQAKTTSPFEGQDIFTAIKTSNFADHTACGIKIVLLLFLFFSKIY